MFQIEDNQLEPLTSLPHVALLEGSQPDDLHHDLEDAEMTLLTPQLRRLGFSVHSANVSENREPQANIGRDLIEMKLTS